MKIIKQLISYLFFKTFYKLSIISFFISFIIVDDASGHYTTGFFWGNNYWTGSMPLCRHIIMNEEDLDFSEFNQQFK